MLEGSTLVRNAWPSVLVIEANAGPVLTIAGRVLFDAEFGAPCPEHGWSAIETWKPACACAACVECVWRVDGFRRTCTPRCEQCMKNAAAAASPTPNESSP